MQCDKCGQRILARFVKDEDAKHRDYIIDTILQYFDVDENYLVMKERSRHRVYVRQVVYYFIREKTSMTLASIGILLNQNHTTIIHSLQKFKDLASIYEPIQRDIEEINKILTIQEHPVISD